MELMIRDFVIDIETRHASKEFIEAAQAEIKRGDLDSRLKKPELIKANEEKIEREYQKALQRVKDKSACLNAAPIGCIGLAADSNLYNWSCFDFSREEMERLTVGEGIEVRTFDTEKDMMSDFAEYLNSHYTDFSRIVGFNSFKFDFPKIRLACRRNGIKMPEILTKLYKDNQVDLMYDFVHGFNCEDSHRLFISLKQVCLEFSIDYRKTLSGAEIPDAIERGEVLQVALDCTSDVIETYQILLKLHG
jgi:hypothetical protein